MSAFVVEDKTINTIVSMLAKDRDFERIRRQLKSIGYDMNTTTGLNKLAQDMHDLNVNAVNTRYGDRPANRFEPFPFRIVCYISRIAAYKSLNCWLCQCAEGDIQGQDNLYKLMQEIEGEIARLVVSSLPEYGKAYWG